MKRLWVALVLFGAALCLFLGLAAWAKMPRGTQRTSRTIGLAPVPATGSTYDDEAPKDDGELQMGVTFAGPQRFTDNGDGTVTDNLTGLVWLKDTNCIATHYPDFDQDGDYGDGAVTWQHALDFVAGINDGAYPLCGAGYTDWRLPNVRELQSLIDYGVREPALPAGHPFTWPPILDPPPYPWYWSSTTLASILHNAAWIVGFEDGVANSLGKSDIHCFVWCVRGGQ
jgi:hypothetical protein